MKYLLAALLLALSACATSPLVAFQVMEGSGAVYTDGGSLVAIGELRGESGAFMRGSGFPVTIPVTVDSGEAYLYHRELGVNGAVSLSEPLPLWVKGLIPPAHLSALQAATNADIHFENADLDNGTSQM